jgi:DNA repair protein RadD
VIDAIRATSPHAIIIGVTGSPYRLDGKGLGVEAGGLYDDLVVGVTLRDLIDDGFLVQPKVYASRETLDLSGVRTVGGDYNSKDLASVVDRPTLVGNAVEHYQKVCPGVPSIAWCVNIAHSEHVAEQFSACGIPARRICR